MQKGGKIDRGQQTSTLYVDRYNWCSVTNGVPTTSIFLGSPF